MHTHTHTHTHTRGSGLWHTRKLWQQLTGPEDQGEDKEANTEQNEANTDQNPLQQADEDDKEEPTSAEAGAWGGVSRSGGGGGGGQIVSQVGDEPLRRLVLEAVVHGLDPQVLTRCAAAAYSSSVCSS
jgi:hypothetical protein